MTNGRIITLARDLEARGVQVDALLALQQELDVIETPPSLLGRVTQRVRRVASTQWKHVIGELQESQEVFGLLTRRVQKQQELTPAERDAIRCQILDLLRVVPAGLIAFANTALPVPGTGLLTPWLLARLGLMPSRWREAHLLARLDAGHRDSGRWARTTHSKGRSPGACTGGRGRCARGRRPRCGPAHPLGRQRKRCVG